MTRMSYVLLGSITALSIAAKPGDHVEPGDVRSEAGYYSVVFYSTPEPTQPSMPTAKALVNELLPDVRFAEEASDDVDPPFVGFEEEKAPLKDFPVPEASYFRHAGRGLGDHDIQAIQGTGVATRLVLVMPKESVWKLSRPFTELVHRYAEKTGAFIWDSATRECFGRAAWKSKRLDGWKTDTIPDISRHTTIHLYREDRESGYLRAITLGMEKFALPDVVIERLVASDNRPAGNLINLVCQVFAENPVIKDSHRQEFRIDSLRSEAQRKTSESTLLDGATGSAILALVEGVRAQGDPDNRLMEISFAHGTGESEDERRQSILGSLWGTQDSIVGARHSQEILLASAKARERLAALRPTYLNGLPPGERLLIKGPFKRDDEGNEWMWVEVLKWPEKEKIEGLLQNDPFHIEKLKAGSRVTLNFDDIFDYLHYRADGTTDGNETGKLIQKQQGPARSKE